MALDLAAVVNEKVAAELAGLNGQLDRLVDEALERELGRLVRERVEAELDLRAGAAVDAPADDESRDERSAAVADLPVTKTCSSCGQAKSLGAFERDRSTCKTCRNRARSEWKRRRREEQRSKAATPPDPFEQ